MAGRLVWRSLCRSPAALAGLAVLFALAVVALAAPWIAPHDPNHMDLGAALRPPGTPGHPLGTDELGRDVLSRLIYGSRVSLPVGLSVVAAACSMGVVLGALGGYWGGAVDALVMRVADVLMAFPFLLLAVVVVAIVGPGLTHVMLVLAGIAWVSYARLVRSLVLAQREEGYVQAARLVGVRHWRIVWRHILPNCAGVIVVQATFDVAAAILVAAALSFLGMGAQPPTAEWGAMLYSAKEFLRESPSLSLAPGLAILLTVLAINTVGDALRDALDPRLRR